MIYPTTWHIALWILLTAAGLLDFFLPGTASIWEIIVAVVAGFALLDAFWGLRKPPLKLCRTLHHNLPVTAWSQIKLKITSAARFTLSLQVHDHCDPDFQVEDQPISFSLRGGHSATFVYKVFPTKRGQYTFPGADILVHSPLRLWQKKWFFPCADATKVFPNFREIGHYVLLATHHHLSMMGIRKLARRGEGKEFHQLREYRKGDELQKIDWKATSRYRRLIAKEYQDERDQQVVFVLDCGRRMRHMENGKSQLDQTLNSILLLAYVAARQGDGVGLYSFGGTQKWLPPRKQEDSVRALMLGMYDIESSTNASDYLRATQDLLQLQGRRSLMVIITNSRAEDHEDLLTMARQLRRKHLVVIANLRENILDDTLVTPIKGFSEAVLYQALQNYLAKRRRLHKQLQHLGVYALDVTAQQLPASIVNTYLEIKSTGKL